MTVKIMMEKESLEKKLGQTSIREKIYRLIGLLGIYLTMCLGLFLIYNGMSTAVESIEVDPHPNRLKEGQPVAPTSVPPVTTPKELSTHESEWITLSYIHDWGGVRNVTLPSKSLVSNLMDHIRADPKNLLKDIFLIWVRNPFTSPPGVIERLDPSKPLDFYDFQSTDKIKVYGTLPREIWDGGVNGIGGGGGAKD